MRQPLFGLLAASVFLAACADLIPIPTTAARPTATPSLAPPATVIPATSTSTPWDMMSPTAIVPPLPRTPSSVPTAAPQTTPSPLPAPSPTGCAAEWFTPVPQSTCPDGSPNITQAAFQEYEGGLMIWLKTPGQYVILFGYISDVGFDLISDPLTIYRDTSADFSAPAGLITPASGFGLVWRGDIFPEAGRHYRDKLGWAKTPESGYEASVQCSHGPTPHWACYISAPGGGLVGYGTPGTWFYARGY